MDKDKKLCLDLRHAFGSITSRKFRDCVTLFDQEKNQPKVLFPVGKYMARKKLDTDQMDFFKLTDNIQQIYCMCISPNKTHIVVCEKIRGQETVQLALYSLRKNEREKKVFKYYPTPEMTTNVIRFLAFAPGDSKLLIALTAEPDNLLMFIDISKARTLAQTAFKEKQISRISINPTNSYVVAITGKNFFKILRMQQQVFRVQHQNFNKLPKNRHFTDHVWYQNSKIILGTDKGQVYIINNSNSVSKSILYGFGSNQSNSINTINTFSKGFILGSNTGLFALWVRNQDSDEVYDQDENLILLRMWRTNQTRIAGITCISINHKQDYFVVAFDNNDIALFDLSQVIPTSYDLFDINAKKNREKELHFEYLYRGFHSGPIASMDVCIHRPLIATCCRTDSTVRIWNYMERRCELIRQFYFKLEHQESSPLMSLAFHPSGYYLALGCIDKLRLYYILYSELRLYRQLLVKGCVELRFSNGGHLLAAVYQKPRYASYQINIYQSYTLEFIVTLTGHNSIITDLIWTPNDFFLISVGNDGNVIQYRTDDWNYSKQYFQNHTKYNSVLFDKNSGNILVSGKQNNKHVFREIRIDRSQKEHRELSQKVFHLGSLRMSKMNWILSQFNRNYIISGYEDGSIKVYNSNFDSIPDQTVNAHMSDIVKIAASPCGRYVFSAGQDGVLLIFQALDTNKDGTPLTSKQNQLVPSEKMELNPFTKVCEQELADIVLIHKSQIQEALKQQKMLKLTIEELEYKMNYIVQEDDKRFKKEMENLKKQKEEEKRIMVEKQTGEIKKLEEALDKAALTLNQENEKHEQAIGQLQNLYQRKLLLQWEKYQQLESKLYQEQILNKQNMMNVQKQHQEAIQQLKEEFSKEMKRVERCYRGMEGAVTGLQKIYKTRLGLVQQEYQKEYEQIQDKWRRKDQENNQTVSNLKELNHKFKKQYDQNSKQLEQLLKKKENLELEKKTMMKDIQDLYKRIDQKNLELEARDQMIKLKDVKLGNYMLKITDLQKSKQVLSYRVTEMRKSLQPKEGQIQKLKQQLFRLEGEFQQMIINMKQYNFNTENLVKINKTLEDSLKKQTAKTKTKQQLINKIIMEIHNCVKNDNPKEGMEALKLLYNKYYNQEERRVEHDPKAVEEMAKQMNQLENTIYGLHHQSRKKIARRTREVFKKTAENSELITQLNNLRKNYKKLSSEYESKNKENENLLRQLQKLKSQMGKNQKKSMQQLSGSNEVPQETQNYNIMASQLTTIHAQKKKSSKLIKGLNFDHDSNQLLQKLKKNQLWSELQMTKMNCFNTKNKLKIIRDKVFQHLEQCHKKDEILQRELLNID